MLLASNKTFEEFAIARHCLNWDVSQFDTVLVWIFKIWQVRIMFNQNLSSIQDNDMDDLLNATISGSRTEENHNLVERRDEVLSWDCEDGVCVLGWKPVKAD